MDKKELKDAKREYKRAKLFQETEPAEELARKLRQELDDAAWADFESSVQDFLLKVKDLAGEVDAKARDLKEIMVEAALQPYLAKAKGLAVVARAAHRAGLTVMVFAGFTLEECRANPLPGVTELLAETDVLVDGPYLADRPERVRNWIGSANQRFRYFTDVYGPDIETDPAFRGQVEFRIEGDILRMNGCPRTLPSDFNLLCADEIVN